MNPLFLQIRNSLSNSHSLYINYSQVEAKSNACDINLLGVKSSGRTCQISST